jgi:hypothetical protein
MTRSETISKLAVSLSKAQSNIGAAAKEAKNPFFKSAYADLGSVMEAVKGPLLEQGISVLQPVGHTQDGLTYVETILLHESGEFIGDKMIVTCAKEKDPQAQGSAISYARRYSLQSMLFVPAQDDDGEGATSRKPNPKEQPQPEAKEGPFTGKPNLKKLVEELAKAGITTDEALATLKYKNGEDGLPSVPEDVESLLVCKDATAANLVTNFGYLHDAVVEWRALKK